MPHSTAHPKHAYVWSHVETGDFIDNYTVRSDLTPQEAVKVAFEMPAWTTALMRLRNIIVAPLGLKIDDIREAGDDEAASLFPVTYEDDTQIVVGADDSHLNFRISVMQHEGQIHMATWVHRNNWIGRAYLAIIMPFHVLIVRSCVNRVAAHKPDQPIASKAKAQ
jgi:hypothetical protein